MNYYFWTYNRPGVGDKGHKKAAGNENISVCIKYPGTEKFNTLIHFKTKSIYNSQVLF